jgi:hypothetical protein
MHAAAEEAAAREGLPLAQYIREAILIRIAWEIGVETGVRDPRIRDDVRLNLRDLARRLGLHEGG